MVGDGMLERQGKGSGETCPPRARPDRSQSPHSTAAATPLDFGTTAAKSPGSKTGPRDSRAGRWMRDKQGEAQTASSVPARVSHGAKVAPGDPRAYAHRSSTANAAYDVGAGNGVTEGSFFPSALRPGLTARSCYPARRRDIPDVETTDWRAVCGKTARTVRREGSARADPYPYPRRGVPASRGTMLPSSICPSFTKTEAFSQRST